MASRLEVLPILTVLPLVWAIRLAAGLEWMVGDDIFRLSMANECRFGGVLFSANTYWLPVTIWWNAAFLWAPIRHLAACQTFSSLVALEATVALLWYSRWFGKRCTLLFLTVPLVHGLSTSVLGEPLYLLLVVASVHLWLQAWNGPTVPGLLALGACLALLCLSRYDGWLSAAALCAMLAARIAATAPRKLALVALAAMPPMLAIGGWLLLNQKVHGTWRHPFEFAAEASLYLSRRGRLWYLVQSAALQAPLLAAGAGYFLLRRFSWPRALAFAAFAAPFVYMIATNVIGSALPLRFGLPPLVAAMGIVGGGGELLAPTAGLRERIAWQAAVCSAACVALVAYGGCVDPEFKGAVRRLRSELRPGETVLVFDHTASVLTLGDLQLLRVLLPPEAVVCSEWKSPQFPLTGEELAEMHTRFVLFRDRASLAPIEAGEPTIVALGNGWHAWPLPVTACGPTTSPAPPAPAPR